jgi:hypothetical protein
VVHGGERLRDRRGDQTPSRVPGRHLKSGPEEAENWYSASWADTRTSTKMD